MMHLRPYILTISLSSLAFLLAHSAPAKIVYVSQGASGDGSGSSWQNACTTITAGLTASASGDEIWVKSATYPEAIEMKEGVALYGGFLGTETVREQRNYKANVTVVDATGLNTHVVVGANLATLDGFTVRGGAADNGGGIYCENTCVTVANCSIEGNRANRAVWRDGYGGGVYCNRAILKLGNCTIADNVGAEGGGLFFRESSVLLSECVITRNWAISGGGLALRECSSSQLNYCRIVNNSAGYHGGGLYVYQSSTIVANTEIVGNTAVRGGGGSLMLSPDKIAVECDSGINENLDCGPMSPILSSCLVAGNVATGSRPEVGGLYFYCTTPSLINCTVAENSGKGLYSYMWYLIKWPNSPPCGCDSFPVLRNCIVWDQKELVWHYVDEPIEVSYDITPPAGRGLVISDSCVMGGWPGSGNTDMDPQFSDPDSGDYHLQAGSPCIDSGSNEVAQDIPLDLDGRIRIWDGVVDMGAYEYASWTPEELRCDLNGDGRIDHHDLFLFRQSWQKVATPIPTP